MDNKVLGSIFYPGRILKACYHLMDIFERYGPCLIAEKKAEYYLCGADGFSINEALGILKKFRSLYPLSNQVLKKWPQPKRPRRKQKVLRYVSEGFFCLHKCYSYAMFAVNCQGAKNALDIYNIFIYLL